MISRIPTTWDETIVPFARVNEYVLIARRKGETWYVGGINNGPARTFSLPLSFLEKGDYTAYIYQDGINAHRHAGDYRILIRTVTQRDTLIIPFAPDGGYVAEIRKN